MNSEWQPKWHMVRTNHGTYELVENPDYVEPEEPEIPKEPVEKPGTIKFAIDGGMFLMGQDGHWQALKPGEAVIYRNLAREFDLVTWRSVEDLEARQIGNSLKETAALVIVKQLHTASHWFQAGSVELPDFQRTEHVAEIGPDYVTVTGPFARAGEFLMYVFTESAAKQAVDAVKNNHTVAMRHDQAPEMWTKIRNEDKS